MSEQPPECVALAALLGEEKVASPGNALYTASLNSYFSQQEIAIQPSCIIHPKTALDVSEAVVALQKQSKPFAIRSGGHASWAGAANIEDGVVIDLRGLNSIELSADRSTVSVGPGASWDMVYSKLDPLGLSVNGGRAAGVGVGGLILSGGISYFSPRYGWTCDTVTNFQIVLADGAIVNANKQTNPDLFQALKGGNNNFGVVTQLDLEVFEQGDIWAATIYNDISLVDEVISQFVKINSPTAYDEYASFITSFGYSQPRDLPIIANQLEYTKAIKTPPVYEEYLALPSLMSTSQITNMTSVAAATQALNPSGKRSLTLVTTLVSSATVLKATYEAWNDSIQAIKKVSNIVYALSLEPLPPAIYARHASTNALGLEDRSDALVVTLITATWTSPDDDALVSETSQSLLDAIKAAAIKLDALDPYVCLNYAGPEQDPIKGYGAKSVSKLQQVQARVDPNKVFTHHVPGGYKIPSS